MKIISQIPNGRPVYNDYLKIKTVIITVFLNSLHLSRYIYDYARSHRFQKLGSHALGTFFIDFMPLKNLTITSKLGYRAVTAIPDLRRFVFMPMTWFTGIS
jgi:hypothetical protein